MSEPLISIICVVRNRAQCIGRAMASILALEDSSWELVVQDGASTDGTLEILRSLEDPRIRLVSEPDAGPEDGFFRALRRCRGEYIGCCLSDEEYLPHALGWVRRQFAANPGAGAIYGQCYATDLQGKIESTFTPVHPFTLERYLRHEVVPPFVASFFRASALRAAGGPERSWRTDVGEFELWTRVAQVAPVVYVPEVVAKYGVHEGCRSRTSAVIAALVRQRREFLDAFFAEPGLTPRMRGLRDAAMAGLHLWAVQSALNRSDFAAASDALAAAVGHHPSSDQFNAVSASLLQAGFAAMDAGRVHEALESVAWIPSAGQRIAGAGFIRGLLLLRAGWVAQALESFRDDVRVSEYDAGAAQFVQLAEKFLGGWDVRLPKLETEPVTPVVRVLAAPAVEESGVALSLAESCQRFGRMLGRTESIGEGELLAAVQTLDAWIQAPNPRQYVQTNRHLFPESLGPLIIHHLVAAWSEKNETLSEALEMLYGLLTVPAVDPALESTPTAHWRSAS